MKARRLATLAAIVLGFFAMGPDEGCIPQRVDVSPDGRTMYLSLNARGEPQSDQTSNLYALDIRTGRLKALTDNPGEENWCVLTNQGRGLLFSRCSEVARSVHWIDLRDTKKEMALAGGTEFCLAPWFIPGRYPCVMMMKAPQEPDADQIYWALYDQSLRPVALALPKNYSPCQYIARAKDRFAVVLVGPDPKGNGKLADLAAFVVDILPPVVEEDNERGTGGGPPRAEVTCAARWNIKANEDVAMAYAAFSADGKRLVVAFWDQHSKPQHTRFYEVDPTGKTGPKHLFNDGPCASEPEWTPTGDALIYMRISEKNDAWCEAVVRPLKDGPPVVLARLPGGIDSGAFRPHWNEDGTLTIYSVSDHGVRLITTTLDGTKASAKRLSPEKLMVQRRLAHFQRALDDLDEMMVPENMPGKLDARLDALVDLRKDLEAEWDKVDDWEEVPVMPEIPEVPPEREEENPP